MPTDTARTALVDATAALLWERGYAATSPRAILDRSGVGQGSMYHHFAGKEALAAAAFEQNAAQLVDRARLVLAGDGSGLDRVRAYLLRERDTLRGCPAGRMAGDPEVLDSAALSRVLRETFERLRQLVTAALDEARDAGELRAGLRTADLADTVLAVVQGGYVLARSADDPAAFDRAVRGAVALLDDAAAEVR